MSNDTARQAAHQKLQALYCRRTAEQRGLLLIQSRLKAINAEIEQTETQLAALRLSEEEVAR